MTNYPTARYNFPQQSGPYGSIAIRRQRRPTRDRPARCEQSATIPSDGPEPDSMVAGPRLGRYHDWLARHTKTTVQALCHAPSICAAGSAGDPGCQTR